MVLFNYLVFLGTAALAMACEADCRSLKKLFLSLSLGLKLSFK